MSKQIILYLHIPKTGGTTLSSCIYGQVCADKYYVAEENYFHSGVYYYPDGFFKNVNASISGPVLRALSRNDIRAVVGHFSFGIDKYINGPITYVTLLRDPVDRVVSLYYHLAPEMSIEQFLTDYVKKGFRRSQTELISDNDQVRRVSGLEPSLGACTRATLETAMSNLERFFSVVGVSECFDETLVLLKRAFSWNQPLSYLPKLRNQNRPSSASLSQEIRDRIAERNALDIELYQFAKQMLDQQISKHGSGFWKEVEELQTSNKRLAEQYSAELGTMGLS